MGDFFDGILKGKLKKLWLVSVGGTTFESWNSHQASKVFEDLDKHVTSVVYIVYYYIVSSGCDDHKDEGDY